MTSLALRSLARSNGPRLRLTAETERQTVQRGVRTHSEAIERRRSQATGESPSEPPSPVLIAGRDPVKRVAVLEDLTQTMPSGTRFEQAGAFWEVLARAPESRMVILSGELDDVHPGSLMHTLGLRHPDLPVVSVDAPPSVAS